MLNWIFFVEPWWCASCCETLKQTRKQIKGFLNQSQQSSSGSEDGWFTSTSWVHNMRTSDQEGKTERRLYTTDCRTTINFNLRQEPPYQRARCKKGSETVIKITTGSAKNVRGLGFSHWVVLCFSPHPLWVMLYLRFPPWWCCFSTNMKLMWSISCFWFGQMLTKTADSAGEGQNNRNNHQPKEKMRWATNGKGRPPTREGRKASQLPRAEEGGHQRCLGSHHLTCASSVCVHQGVNLTCRPSIPTFYTFFKTAPHDWRKALVRDVRGCIRCVRLLFIVSSRGKYMCHILGKCKRSSEPYASTGTTWLFSANGAWYETYDSIFTSRRAGRKSRQFKLKHHAITCETGVFEELCLFVCENFHKSNTFHTAETFGKKRNCFFGEKNKTHVDSEPTVECSFSVENSEFGFDSSPKHCHWDFLLFWCVGAVVLFLIIFGFNTMHRRKSNVAFWMCSGVTFDLLRTQSQVCGISVTNFGGEAVQLISVTLNVFPSE